MIFLFLLILLLYLVIYTNPLKKGGGTVPNYVSDSDVLIVDIANMFVGWKMEKYKFKKLPRTDQDGLIEDYLECMHDHYVYFHKHNPHAQVNYVIKNYKHINHKKVDVTPMSDEIWEKIKSFTITHTLSTISVALDYSVTDITLWKSTHYLRGVDDYLCFHIAREYKRKYMHAVIMSDDSYRDFTKMGFVPKFEARIVYNGVIRSEMIQPRENSLGQLVDYNMVKLTTAFEFGDPLFTKNNAYKIEVPGSVWKI